MKPRKPRAPRETPFEKWAADQHRRCERVQRELDRKISAWARSWERCPLAACRRNHRCLRDGDSCRAISQEPLTNEDYARIGAALKPALAARIAEIEAKRGKSGRARR